jgi:hypothetical protein
MQVEVEVDLMVQTFLQVNLKEEQAGEEMEQVDHQDYKQLQEQLIQVEVEVVEEKVMHHLEVVLV